MGVVTTYLYYRTLHLESQATPPYELLEYRLITQLLLNWKKSIQQTNSLIINKCSFITSKGKLSSKDFDIVITK